jgi:hypothetical protein
VGARTPGELPDAEPDRRRFTAWCEGERCRPSSADEESTSMASLSLTSRPNASMIDRSDQDRFLKEATAGRASACATSRNKALDVHAQ